MTATGEEHDTARIPGVLVEAVVRIMPDATVVVDDGGVIVAANTAAERQFRYLPGTLVGLTVETLIPERFHPRHVIHRASYAAKPTRRSMGAGLLLVAVRRDGSEFPVDVSLAPLTTADRRLSVAAIRDITAQRAEWETEARLAAVVASSDEAILSFDLSGTVTSCNPAAERLFGFETSGMVGHSFWRLVPDDQRHEVEEHMAQIRAGLRVYLYDTTRIRRDGRRIDVAETMSLVPDASGAPAGFSAVSRDITERKRSEDELRSLLAETQRRERWLGAMSELRLALLGGTERQHWLDLVTQRICELSDADNGLVAMPSDSDPDVLHVAAIRGEGLIIEVGDAIPLQRSLAGQAFQTGRSVVSEDFSVDSPAPPVVRDDVPIGPIVAVPIRTSSGSAGVLMVSRAPGRAKFGEEDIRLIESFGQQAGLGVELARAQEERSQFVLLADRERIARDLHDHVIQRLFGVGMSLQAAAHSISDPKALERIEQSVEELDATIRGVRSTIFSLELRATEHVETSTRARILEVASSAASALGFQPRLQFEGPVDTKVPEEMVHDLIAVVRESLSNTARHAGASAVEVHVTVGDELVIEVTDDGRGAAGRTRSSGLTNLRVRAERRLGTLHVGESRNAHGTVLVWRVPLP